MNKEVYLIRHSAPFVKIDNYEDYKNVPWREFNKNMILSIEGERRASLLVNVPELRKVAHVFCSNSFRAIGTAKYLSEANNVKLTIDPLLTEREMGVEKISDLDEDFTRKSFNNKEFKVPTGESLKETDDRFNKFLAFNLKNEKEPFAVVIHGMMLLSYLQNYCDFAFDSEYFMISFNGKTLVNGKLLNPDVFKITYNSYNEIINIDRIVVS